MNGELPSDDKSKVFDVAKPGTTPPSPNSRPIVGTAPSGVKDSTVKDSAATDSPGSAPSSHKKIGPVSENVKPEVKPEDVASPSSESSPTGGSTSSESAEVSALADAADSNKKSDKKTEADLKQQAETQKLIDSKVYNVPISSSAKQKGNKVLIILLVLILIAGGAYLAADAGFISGINVPVHIVGS